MKATNQNHSLKFKAIMCFAITMIFCSLQISVASSTWYVSATGNNSNPGSFASPWLTIQFAIDNAVAGDVINVLPGTYNNDEANGRDPNNGGAGSNDFNIFIDKALTIKGVDAIGNDIVSYLNVAAFIVGKRNLPTFGTSAIFIQAAGVTIQGLDVTTYEDLSNYSGKTIETSNDNFTIKYCSIHALDQTACIYMSDFHYNNITDVSTVQTYHIENCYINGGGIDADGIRIESGAGWTGSSANRIINGNTFFDNIDAIAFVGPGVDPWDVYPVGAASITNNNFSVSDRRHVLAYGIYNSLPGYGTIDWNNIIYNNGNTFDKGASTWHSDGITIRTWNSGSFSNVTGLYSKIKNYAVSKAENGDIIKVLPGNYTEAGQIVIAKNITMIGADKATTIIKPDANTTYGGAWILVNSGISFDLSKVTLDGTGKLIYAGIKYLGSGTVNDCNLTGMKYNESTDYKGTAIFINSTATVNVTNCNFSQIGRNGILADQCLGTYSGNTYTGKGAGDWLDYFILSEYGDHVTISNNTISDCLGIASSDGSGSSGIAVWDDPGTQAIISGNTLTNNSIGVAVVGINGPTTDPQVDFGAGNLFDGGEYGVAFQSYSGPYAPVVTFSGVSTFKGQTNKAIHIDDGISAGVTIDISSAVFKTAGGVTITNNFSKEDLVVHAIDGTNRALLMWNANNVYVTSNSFVSPFSAASIQRAIDVASSGWTVNVDAGTYTEQLSVDSKNLTITGAGTATTIIQAPGVLANDPDGAKTLVLFTGACTSELSGFTLQGPVNGINFGIYVRAGATVNIHNNTIRDIRDNPLSGAQNGYAICVGKYNNTFPFVNQVGHATITDNIIFGYQKTGIACEGAGSDATITGNTVTGAGLIPTNAQNGIQIRRGATGSINTNVVTGNAYTGHEVNASGIIVTYPGNNVIVQGNTVNHNTANIYTYEANGIQILNNQVSDAADGRITAGITADADNVATVSVGITVTITGNSIKNNLSGGSHLGNGIFLWGVKSGTVSANEIVGNGDDGLLIGASGNLNITNNLFSGNGLLAADPNAAAIDFAGIIPELEIYGLQPNPLGGFSIHDNSFTGNPKGIWNYDAATVDATCNWFGSIVPSVVATKVSANVSYIPYLHDGTDNNLSIGFQPLAVCSAPCISLNPAPVISNISCRGSNTGVIDLTPTGGTGIYSYLWNTGSTTEDKNNLFAGGYSVTITDANGCTTNASFTVTQPATVLIISLSKTNVRCGGKITGIVTALPSGGGGGYSYAWSINASTGIGYPSAASVSNLAAGTYTVTVTDANLCVKTKSGVVTQNAPVVVAVSPIGPLTKGTTVSGGVGPYTYNWNSVNASPQSGSTNGFPAFVTTFAGAGTYKIKVTDTKGCTTIVTVAVSGTKLATQSEMENVFNAFVYPNPSDGMVMLNMSSPLQQNCNINMYDALGKLVYTNLLTTNEQSIQLDFSMHPKGIYSLSITAGDQIKVFRLLLQ